MKHLTQLLFDLDKTKDPQSRKESLLRFFNKTNDLDRMWGLWLLTGHKPRKIISPAQLREWSIETSGIPEWLFEESLALTGDLAEICALIWTETKGGEKSLEEWIVLLLDMGKLSLEEKKEILFDSWENLSQKERYWFNRLLIGTFRITLARKTLVDALSDFTQKPAPTLWYRLEEDWSPREISFENLFLQKRDKDEWVKPLSFAPVQEVSSRKNPVKNISGYQAEWYWKGIEAQLIKRQGQLFIWTSHGEWLTGKFPELDSFVEFLPDNSVLIGNILGLREGRVLESKFIENRAARKKPTKKIMQDCPAVFLANDLLEWQGRSLENKTLQERWEILKQVLAANSSEFLLLAEAIDFKNWSDLKTKLPLARDEFAKGILLRKLDGNSSDEVLFLPAPPLSLLAVLLYVTRDDRNPGNFSELSFAVWKGEDLVPLVKCKNNLSDFQNEDLSIFVKQNIIERFGPVISVEPELIFLISYTGMVLSARKKSGLDLQSPVVENWEKDLELDEVDDISSLHQLQRKLSGEL